MTKARTTGSVRDLSGDSLSSKDKDILIAPWETTRWLVLSSFFFMVPAWYSYINSLTSYSALLICTSLVSANYWKKATYSWRRNMDLCVAKLSFIIFLSNGIYYIRSPQSMIPGYGGLVVLSYCYYMSGKQYVLKNKYWYKYHMAFHVIMAYEQTLIFYCILRHRPKWEKS